MTRQNVRRGILLVSFLLLPATFFFFSPVVIMRAAGLGILSGSGVTFAFLFVGSIIVGRGFCGWCMPCGGFQEACFPVNDRRVRGGKPDRIKFAIWAIWLGGLFLLFARAGGVRQVDPLFGTWHGISISEPWVILVYFAVASVFLVLSLAFGRRPACHYVCWMAPFMIVGRRLGNLLRVPSLRLSLSGVECVHCGACTRACPMSLDVEKKVAAGRLEDPECILCAACADSCPKKVLRLGFGRAGSK